MHLRASSLFLLIALAIGCNREKLDVHFIIPDGYRGVLRLQEQVASGIVIRPTNGVVELRFSSNGVCAVQGELPVRRWHTPSARYESGEAIPVLAAAAGAPDDQFGLRTVGNKQGEGIWYLLGTQRGVKPAMDKMYGFDVPQR